MLNKQRRRFPLWGFGVLGFVLGVVLVGVLASPKVIAVEPGKNATEVPSTAPVRILFNRPMDPQSVLSHLMIQPERLGQVIRQGNQISISPQEPWPSGETVTITLQTGARSDRFLPLLFGETWSFQVGEPRVIYLWPASEQADLYTRSIAKNRETQHLSETAAPVLDYNLSADGVQIVYATVRDDRGNDLRLYDLLSGEDRLILGCEPEVRCKAPSLSPDGNWLAYELESLSVGVGGVAVMARSRVWIVPVNGEAEPTPMGPEEHITGNPGWSPTGWLTYFDTSLQAIALVDIEENQTTSPFSYLPSSLGVAGAWSPDGLYMAYPEIVFPADAPGDFEHTEGRAEGEPLFYSHLYRVEAISGLIEDISPGEELMVEDASPVYSPDGNWIAFTRRYLDPLHWAPGRQIWLMRADGSEARPLTDDSAKLHTSIAWSLDSKRLVFMRRSASDFSQPSEIVWLDISDPQLRPLVEGGFLPRWIP
jgi:TolB protein